MKAITYETYGPPDVLHLQEVPKPSPKPHEVLVRIHATTVTSGDCRVRSLTVPLGIGRLSRLVFGLTRPRHPLLGSELAGVAEAVDPEVTRFKAGVRPDHCLGGCRIG